MTAGPWTSQILSQLGLPLRVLRKVLLWFQTAQPERFRRDRFPIYMVESPTGFYYGFPVIDGRGHKLARHDGGSEVVDPLNPDRSLRASDEAACLQFLMSHIPAAASPLTQHEVCMYTVTPDQHFILDRHPTSPRVTLGAGFSGHGFKFASVIGEILTDLSCQGSTRWPIERFQLSRFGLHLSRYGRR